MKLNTIITGCALAAGLMAFAPDQSQAGIVIGNTLYSPLTIKATYSYVGKNGKIQKVSIKNKDILNYYGYPSGSQLAYLQGDDVYVIRKGVILDDLTYLGEAYVNYMSVVSNGYTGKYGAFHYAESGIAFVDFYSEADSDLVDDYYSFALQGTYSLHATETVPNKHGKFTETVTSSTSTLSGEGYDYDVSDGILPVSGSASADGSGTLVGP